MHADARIDECLLGLLGIVGKVAAYLGVRVALVELGHSLFGVAYGGPVGQFVQQIE